MQRKEKKMRKKEEKKMLRKSEENKFIYIKNEAK